MSKPKEQRRWLEVAPKRVLCYPDWLVSITRPDSEKIRGRAGYVVDTNDLAELALLDGQWNKLVPTRKRKASPIEHSGVIAWAERERERAAKEKYRAERPDAPLDALNEDDEEGDEEPTQDDEELDTESTEDEETSDDDEDLEQDEDDEEGDDDGQA